MTDGLDFLEDLYAGTFEDWGPLAPWGESLESTGSLLENIDPLQAFEAVEAVEAVHKAKKPRRAKTAKIVPPKPVRTHGAPQNVRDLPPDLVFDVRPQGPEAKLYVVFVETHAQLASSALQGLNLLGKDDLARDLVKDALETPRPATWPAKDRSWPTRQLLAGLARLGLGLLVSTGSRGAHRDGPCDEAKAEDNTRKNYGTVQDAFQDGALMLLMDKHRNAIALVRPMGVPVYAPGDEPGFLAPDLKNRDYPTTESVQMWTTVLAVLDFPLALESRWTALEGLRFHVDKLPKSAEYKNLGSQGNHVLFNRRTPTPNLMGAPLASLGEFLRGYKDALATFDGRVPRDDPTHASHKYVYWRRAFLLQSWIDADVTGRLGLALAAAAPGAFDMPMTMPIPIVPGVPFTLDTRFSTHLSHCELQKLIALFDP